MNERYDVTSIISTYNRSKMLEKSLASALCQESHGIPYEVIVVDNHSTDDTRKVVERYIVSGHNNLRYIFEPRQVRGPFVRNRTDAPELIW